mgnify:CR=1 FL=1
MRDFWSLPGPMSFIGRITSELTNGRNVVLRMPSFAPPGLTTALRVATSDRWHLATVDVFGDVPPALAVSQLFSRTF